ncbi:MAG: leucyl/phenylalanyl-tRNA--protein transferase [Magnetococcales bacterium]|nr:leucyl/phenylalanyl-tRNA--protein transferase [Magnetococcales bacterium]
MPVFRLSPEPLFPPVELAEENGLLAVGGDLSVKRLLSAYSQGIFPWYSEGQPILWWSPDPRMVLVPAALHRPRSLEKFLRRSPFRITFDQAFDEVIHACATVRQQGEGTWITAEMAQAYIRLHRQGFAHSVEAWLPGDPPQLAGGLYGVALGGVFFGESMFHRVSEASKAAFVTLADHLQTLGYRLIDCQMNTDHLARFGAREIPRPDFLRQLREALALPAPDWSAAT